MDSNQFVQEINRQLAMYANLVDEEIDEVARKVAEESVQKLKQTSPVGKTGKYAKGWKVKKQNGAYIIHNATSYQLTHLLEHGHALRNGGRSKAMPHIKPVEEQAIKDFEKGLIKAVENR